MRYIGSKKRLAKDIVEYINNIAMCENIHNLYEPFCGGCAISFEVLNNFSFIKNIYCNDKNKYLIALFNHLKHNEIEYKHYTKEEYDDIRQNFYNGTNKYSLWETAYVGFIWSYRAKWFASYVDKVTCKSGRIMNLSYDSHKTLMSDLKYIRKINYSNINYWELDIKSPSIIYCDAPYKDTMQYRGAEQKFNFDRYYNWLKEIAKTNLVLVSEYSMPSGFKEIKSWDITTINGKLATEKLYVVDNGYLVDKYFGNAMNLL
jgi:site-specific DNA-adenine methylase